MFNIFFLPFFYLKERHYIKTSRFPCNSASILISYTLAGVVEMLELVGTFLFNSISTGICKCELKLCCFFNLNLFLPDKKGNFLPFISFSIRQFLSFYRRFIQEVLQILKILPSLFYNSEGRG